MRPCSRFFLFAGLLALAGGAWSQTLIKRTLDPSISPDGSTIAFSWQGDIWTAPASGGQSSRLTVHPADDTAPIWTPDGKAIIFSSNRYGVANLFWMSKDGQGLRRLTYESVAQVASAVSPDGRLVYGTTSAWGRSDVFQVPIAGGDLVRLTSHPLESKYAPDISPDGSKIALCIRGSASQWRGMNRHGSNTSEVYMAPVSAPLRGYQQLTHNEFLDMTPRFLSNNELLVMSNRDGNPNLWRLSTDGKSARKVTSFTGGTIKNLTISPLAKKAVFQHESEVWISDVTTGESHEITLSAPDDARRNPVQEFTLASGIDTFSVSPNGKKMALGMRGDLFLIPEAGGTTRQLTTSPRFDGQPVWLDDQSVLYVAAKEDGKRTLRIVTAGGVDNARLEDILDLTHPVLSPNRKLLAFHRGDREICVMPIGGGGPIPVATGAFGAVLHGPEAFSWAPDSEHILVTKEVERGGTQIDLVSVNGQESVTLGRIGKSASTAQFLPNGKTIFFTGIEGVNYSEVRESKTLLYTIDLVPQPVTYTEDDLDKIDEEPAAKADREAKPTKIKVVTRGLKTRRRTLTSVNVSGAWAAADGKSIYTNIDGQLAQVSVATGTVRPVAAVTGSVRELSVNKGKTYFVQQGKLFAIDSKSPAPTSIPFSARVSVNLAHEEMALFNEAWWALDRLYYDEKHHGKDWDAVRAQFAGIVPYVTSRDDFYALMGEMVERLDSSHQGATSSAPYLAETAEVTGWLGVEWDWAQVAQGKYFVAKVFEGTPASLPDSELRVGDQILSVDGVRPGEDHALASLLTGKAGRKTKLSVQRASRTVDILIKPIPSSARSAVSYSNWVQENRDRVDKLSGGKLGYIHIQAMDEPSLDTFLRESQTELVGRKGVVVDVRFNGGGYTGHIILNTMRKVPWLKRRLRDNLDLGITENLYRGNALELPSACLTNEYSFSNAEIFSEGYRRMGLGPIIGEPTAGGVIGTGSYALWDGGAIRMPGSGVFTVDGEDLENHGRRVDYDIRFDPNGWDAGHDGQIEKAVELLLKQIK